MTDYLVCAYCYGRGIYNVPAVTTVGMNTACRACADDRCLACGYWRPDLGVFCSGCAGECD
jgi:hypothetical protein